MNKIWEIGSEYHWSDRWITHSAGESVLPTPFVGFATGRGALAALLRYVRKSWPSPRLHLPSFFCMEVAAAWATEVELCWYRDLPDAAGPDLNSLRAKPGDCVLVLNHFGLRDGSAWRDWRGKPDIIMIEDHTHDPGSDWARNSQAHFAIASLRKTAPLPDGAILWSPQGLALPAPVKTKELGAGLKLAAMMLKGAYLRNGDIPKSAFRSLQLRGEDQLSLAGEAQMSNFSNAILPYLDWKDLRTRRLDNAKTFAEALAMDPLPNSQLLTKDWATGATPFNTVLLCPSRDHRDGLHAELIGQNIYAAVHWRQAQESLNSGDPEAMALAERVITIPTDFRYERTDVVRVVNLLRRFDR